MKVLAFLQNQWFRNPAKIKQIIQDAEFPDAREFYIKTFLFWGCLTGRRIKAALGEAWIEQITFEECSREMGNSASSRFPADLQHIQQVIDKHKPTVVIAFGQLAKDALMQLYERNSFVLLLAPHPAARQSDVSQQLRELKRLLDIESELQNARPTV